MVLRQHAQGQEGAQCCVPGDLRGIPYGRGVCLMLTRMMLQRRCSEHLGRPGYARKGLCRHEHRVVQRTKALWCWLDWSTQMNCLAAVRAYGLRLLAPTGPPLAQAAAITGF